MDSKFYRRISKIGLKNRWEKEHSKVKINKKLTKELVSIQAYLAGDGWISIRKDNRGYSHYEIKVFPDDKMLANTIVKLFQKEFGIEPKIIPYPNYFRVEIQNKPICLYLLSLANYGTHNWKIPKRLNNYLLKEWLKSFYDCESNVDLKGRRIALKSVNFRGLLDIEKKLEQLKIRSKRYGPYQPKNKNHSDYGILIITGKDLKTYQRLINFNHPVKKVKLEQLCAAIP